MQQDITTLPLHEILLCNGYMLDKDKSSRNNPVLVNDDGQKLVISKKGENYLYFNTHDDNDRGNIISFARIRGIQPKELLKNYDPALAQSQAHIFFKAPTQDSAYFARQYKKFVACDVSTHPLLERRGFAQKVLTHYQGLLKQDEHGNLITAQYKLATMTNPANKAQIKALNVCGYTKRLIIPITKNKDGTPKEKPLKNINYGNKGFEILVINKEYEQIKTIIISESIFDSLALMQMSNKEPKDCVLLSTSGNFNLDSQKEALELIFDKTPNAKIVLCFDNDEQGRSYTKALENYLIYERNTIPTTYVPFTKDCNDDLRLMRITKKAPNQESYDKWAAYTIYQYKHCRDSNDRALLLHNLRKADTLKPLKEEHKQAFNTMLKHGRVKNL